MLYVVQTALELGFMYALVAMALFLSYRILDIADMTTDSGFVLGAAVSVTCAAAGHPVLAVFAAMAAGACAGYVTAFLQTRMGVPSILAGIITNTGLYTVNLSVGSYGKRGMSEDSALVKGVNRAWDAGLVVVVAAGNNGPAPLSVTTPGISRKVITVGCSDDHMEVLVGKNRMVDYSGRGPTMAAVCKPDLVAPGCSVASCASLRDKYTIKSGTSMSTPIVSGAIALLLEKYPDMTNRDVKLRLMETCRDMGLPKNQQGWGLLDVERLLR